jgi:CubicO group peptidase (beta-lactamase class C family)
MKKVAAAVFTIILCISAGYAAKKSVAAETETLSESPAVGLHMAALMGNLDAVRQHIEAGSDLNEKDVYGSTPLIIATTFGKTEVAKALIEAGVNLEITNSDGSAPLHVATFFCRTEIVKALLTKGAKRYSRNNTGATALDIASTPFDEDKEIYDRLGAALAPLGLKLVYGHMKATRPMIAEILRPRLEDLAELKYKPSAGDDWKVSTPAQQGLDPLLVAELYGNAAEMERLYGLLVIKNGYLIAENYFNGSSAEQKALLQSVMKSYTSALVGIALDQGCLSSVDQKMMGFFPEFSEKITDWRKEQITIRYMLQMRAGYPWEESTPELFKILYDGFRLSHMVDVALTSDPGTAFNYSNLTSHLLGVIVVRTCGKDLQSYAQEYLFSPMAVEVGEPWWKDWDGYYIGHGGIRLTARDAAKFGMMYLNDGEYAGKRVVSKHWVRDSLKSYSKNVSSGAPTSGKTGRYFRNTGYGYQWWSATVGDHRINYAAGHGGNLIVLLDDLDMIIVTTSDPFHGQHDDESWKHELASFNLVGMFINSLPKK